MELREINKIVRALPDRSSVLEAQRIGARSGLATYERVMEMNRRALEIQDASSRMFADATQLFQAADLLRQIDPALLEGISPEWLLKRAARGNLAAVMSDITKLRSMPPFANDLRTDIIQSLRTRSTAWQNSAGVQAFREGPMFRALQQRDRIEQLFARMDDLEKELLNADPLAARLAVLLHQVGVGRVLDVMELLVSSGRKPLIDALADVLLDEDAFTVFKAAIQGAVIRESVRGDLTTALDHLEGQNYQDAFPPLQLGLEGALRDAARARGERKPGANARAVAAALSLEKEQELLIGAIYGEINDGRHGDELDRHAACVLALVGVVVWIEAAFEKPAIQWLGRRLNEAPALAA